MTDGAEPLALGPGGGRRFGLPTRGRGRVKLGAADSDGTLSAFELDFEPGEGPGLHVHTREHELWYVLDGEFRFLLGDALVPLPAGGLAFGPRGTPHTFQNVGSGLGRLLVVTGPAGLEHFFLAYDRLASGPYDAPALAAAAEVGGIAFVGPPLAVMSEGERGLGWYRATEPRVHDGGVAEIVTFCPLCVSRCGATATVEDGRLLALRPAPGHPTGQALCVKGKAAPAVVDHPDRLLHPLRRTAPKGAADPGWEPIGWDEALDTIATRLMAIAAESGPEAVVFGSASPSTSAMSDSVDWVVRLKRAFGSPNFCSYMELCGWGRHLASTYTYGEPVPGTYLPDLDNAGCILFWGYNPSVARLAHATATTAALRRGARLIVVDPRRAGLASKAEQWLRVRPGTDGALALSLTHVMLERGWYDAEFLRDWTNAFDVVDGRLVLDLIKAECARFAPPLAAAVTGVPEEQIVATARLLWEARPLAFYTWSGLEQQSNATQTVRAIGQLYALTGCLDAPGGNVLFTPVPTNPIDGAKLLSRQQRAKTIGAADRPLGPARFEFVSGEDLYRAALDHIPYRARALVNFGANLVMGHGDSARGRDALAALDFFAHADLFLSPTAEQADIVLPVASGFESAALRVGFEISQDAQSTVQLREPLARPRGEARSDLQIVFALAVRLGLGEHFFDGDIEAAWRHQLAPSGITLEQLREHSRGVRLPLRTQHRKYLDRGFRTPSGKVELYSHAFAAAGYPPIPTYVEPSIGPHSRPDLAAAFPLVLTCAKSLFFCETQHRQVASLRASAPDPQVEVHPGTAAARGIAAGDWVRLSTPSGSVRARAKLNANLAPDVVVGQHGWWQACPELGLDGYPPYGDGSANLNLVLAQGPSDPVSGSSPLRASLCELTRA